MDIETYNRTQGSPGGPIILPSPILNEQKVDEPISTGVLIGRTIGLVVVIALGIYAYYAV